MHAHRRLFILSLLALTLLSVLMAHGRAPATATAAPAAAPAAPTYDLTPGPFSTRWSAYKSIAYQADYLSFSDPIHRRLFLSNDAPGMDVFDSDTGALVKHLDYQPMRHDFNGDAGRLFLTTGFVPAGNRTVTIHVLNAATLTEIRAITYTCVGNSMHCDIRGVAEGPGGRLYVARHNAAAFDILDGTTGAVLHSVVLNSASEFSTVTLFARGNTLFVSEGVVVGQDEYEYGVAPYDISQLVPVRGDILPTDNEPWITPAPGGQYLFARTITHNYLISTDPFELVWDKAPGWTEFGGIYPDGNMLFHERQGDYRRLVAVIDPHTGRTARSMVAHDSGFHRPLADGGMATFLDDTITLHRAGNYALAIQTVWNNACPGGTFQDGFDDPVTGWPVFDQPHAAARYLNSGYQIELRQPGRAVAVTRGDYWNDSLWLKVDGNQPVGQDGTYGILFGLNDNWTEFYTAEIYPDESLWAVFHYSGGRWTLLQSDTYYHRPDVGTRFEIDHNLQNGETNLKIDYTTWVLLTGDITGRVGLIAQSIGVPVHALYDSYAFTDTYCRGPLPQDRAATATTGDGRRDAGRATPDGGLEIMVLPARPELLTE